MKQTLPQIFQLYFRNPSFRILSIIFFLSALISKWLYLAHQTWWAEDVTTVLFIVTLWLTFYMGLIVKRQLANHRASLLPGYRRQHMMCFFVLYLIYVLVIMLWRDGLRPMIEITEHAQQGILAACLLAALGVTWIGYLSMGRIFIYFYAGILIMAKQTLYLLDIFEQAVYLKYILSAGSLLLVVGLAVRLTRLKEDHFEYGYLLAWPPRKYIVDQVKASQSISNIFDPWLKIFRVKRAPAIPPYPRDANLFVRSRHWDYVDRMSIVSILFWMTVAAPLYMLFIQRPEMEKFFRNVYTNFLLLTMTPVLVALGSQYKRITYWGYDLLKPVKKESYVKERGVVVLRTLFSYWIVFIVCLVLIPNYVFKPEVLHTLKFWAFFLLTGTFSFLTLTWIAYLGCESDSKRVVIHGIILASLVLIYFSLMPAFSILEMVMSNVVCLTGGVILTKLAYRGWCEQEFV